MNKYIKNIIDSDTEFQELIRELTTNATVLEMNNYKQHYETTCFEHCYVVSYYCYLITKKYKLDFKSAARAGMLHDLFLYNWREKQPEIKGFHAFTHGKTACKNASNLFELNKKEKNMILEHMWPVTLKIPSSIESLVLTFVDKYCAISESVDILKEVLFLKKPFRLVYNFFCLFSPIY